MQLISLTRFHGLNEKISHKCITSDITTGDIFVFISLIYDIIFVRYKQYQFYITNLPSRHFSITRKMSKQNKMITGLEKHIIYNSNHFTFMKVKLL